MNDPDGTLWEFYILEGDLDHRGAGQTLELMRSSTIATGEGEGEWEHRLGDPIPDLLPLADGSVGEVRLRGTFNMQLSDETKRRLVREASRVLRPGGRIFVHVLVGEKEMSRPGLPGPAAKVELAPIQSEPTALLNSAGFVKLNYLKFEDKPCFIRDGVPMREMQLEGWKAT